MRGLFEQYGVVSSVVLVRDRDSGRPRGFAFVDMDDQSAAEAMLHMNHIELQGRVLRINRARQRGPDPGRAR